MFIQSFIYSIISIILIIIFLYKNFIKENNNDYYKRISDKQRKFLHIYNIVKFRNILFDYCDSLDLCELKQEIENNDFKYINQLLQIKNKIDFYYKKNNIKFILENKYSDEDSEQLDSDIEDLSQLPSNEQLETDETDEEDLSELETNNEDSSVVESDDEDDDEQDEESDDEEQNNLINNLINRLVVENEQIKYSDENKQNNLMNKLVIENENKKYSDEDTVDNDDHEVHNNDDNEANNIIMI